MRYENLSVKMAQSSSFSRARVGAVIEKGGRVLSVGVNKLRYTKRNGRPWPSIHAEEEAILRVLKEPDGLRKLHRSTLYVSRITKDGRLANAKPCSKCQQLIDAVGIRKVVHT